MSNDKNQPARRNPWELDKEFFNEGLGLCVRVKRLPAGTRTRYSLEVGGIRDGKFTPYLNPQYSVEYSKVTMRYDGLAMSKLIDEAQLYVAERIQAQEDRYIELKQQREQRDLERVEKLGAKPGQGLARFKQRAADSKSDVKAKVAAAR
jgi:hypothetical protein